MNIFPNPPVRTPLAQLDWWIEAHNMTTMFDKRGNPKANRIKDFVLIVDREKYKAWKDRKEASRKIWNDLLRQDIITTITKLDNMKYKIGDRIVKTTGDYTFFGTVVSTFVKLDGTTTRVVAENPDGICHIFSENQLELAPVFVPAPDAVEIVHRKLAATKKPTSKKKHTK